MLTKYDLKFPKPNQIVKSEKHEIFRFSKLSIWRQKWVTSVRQGNSLVVRQISPGKVIHQVKIHTKAIVWLSSQIATPVKNDIRNTVANIFTITLEKASIEVKSLKTG